MSSRWAAKSPMSGYLVAIAATLIVLLLRLLLSGILGETAYFFPFVIAVTVSAWYGGLKPGLLSTVLGAIFAIFFFVPPYYTFRIADSRIATGLVFFVIANVTISLVCNALHKALRTLELSEAKAVQHVKDIERRDRALRDAQNQLHLITDSMSALVTRCTRDLKYSWVSKPYADWLGLSREKIIGASIEEIIGREAFAVLLPYYQSVLKGATVQIELEINYQTIGPRWVDTVYTPTTGADGKPDGWVGVVVDIDEQKRSEEALRITDRRKDTFLAVLAHELRNPLAPMRNSLEILKRAPESNVTLHQQARMTIERQLSHMVRLVDDLLDLSRINSDKLELQRHPVTLAEVVSQAVETVRPLIADAGHELSIDLPAEPMRLNADTVRLSQAFSNLLNNACKYTDPGGYISLSAAREDGHVVIAIRDNGVGIPKDLSPKIFEMFTQGDQSIERQHGGLGIGLALVKRLVEMHDGEVTAGVNPNGQGSEFRVKLPLMAAASESATSIEEPANANADRSRRILVVDDNYDSAESLSLLMQMLGNEVSVAHDGEEALKKAIEIRPAVVLLDIGLPKMNGYDVARNIRAQPWGKNPMLIAITGWGQAEDKHLSKQAGFDHHLVKPVDPDTLANLFSNRKD